MIDVKTLDEALDLSWCLRRLRPKSPYGLEYKKALKPYPRGTEEFLRRRLDSLERLVTWCKETDRLKDLLHLLSEAKELRTTISRAKDGAILSEVELFEVKALVGLFDKISRLAEESNLPMEDDMALVGLEELWRLFNPKKSREDSFYIYDTYSLRIAQVRGQRADAENRMRRGIRDLKKRLREDFDIRLGADNTLLCPKADEEMKNRLEACGALRFQSETYSHLIFSLRLPEEIQELTEEVERLKEAEEAEERRIRGEISKEVGKYKKELFHNIHALGRLDLDIAKARMALEMEAVKPEICDDVGIFIDEGRHPKIEAALKEKDLSFTPISLSLTSGVTCITGANMGGKTISLKLTGLLALMAQMGLFVPAKSMGLGLLSHIKTSIGDMQSTDSGLSTFGGEIRMVADAMKVADEPGLILIDELARGTNPREGYAISRAIVDDLRHRASITLLTTHFDRITEEEGVRHLQVTGLGHVNFDEFDVSSFEDRLSLLNRMMDYRLVEVSKDTKVPKDAIAIARIMGLSPEVLSRAEETNLKGW